MELKNKILGGLYGLLVGDALGVPYEFNPPGTLPGLNAIEFRPPDYFQRSHEGVPPGTWSDDGAQALCLLASLLQENRLNATDLMNRISNWYEAGYMAVDYKVFDVGVQTASAIAKYRNGSPASESGGSSEMDNGNGSLMRALPLALWHQGDDQELFDFSMEQSKVTHGHARSLLCCAQYCLWARYELLEGTDAWAKATEVMRSLLIGNTTLEDEYEYHLRPDDEPEGTGSGYVVDSLRSARMVVATNGDYESTVKAAVALGHDTDTTACIAGGIAGIRYGFSGIPDRWVGALRGKELLGPIQKDLLVHLGLDS